MVTISKTYQDHESYADIENVVLATERVQRLKQRLESADEHICAERSRIVTESWRETEGEPLDIRRAKLFYKIMKENPIVIRDDELIVGSQTKYVKGASPYIDYTVEIIKDNLLTDMSTSEKPVQLASSSATGAVISEEDRQSILEDYKFWAGRTTGDAVYREIESRFPWYKDWIDSGLIVAQQVGSAPPQVRHVDYARVINEGLEAIILQAEAELQKLRYDGYSLADYEKDCFLRGAIIACQGAIEFAHRYALLAESMAEKESDPRRKRELETIAKTCWWVPAKPARSFYEAVQSYWFTQLCVNLETATWAECPARIDQYLYPFYYKDVIKEGNMSRQEAAELMACLFIKLNEITSVRVNYDKDNIPGTTLQDTTICGVTRDGKDASNELSYLILKVLEEIPLPQPPVYVRYHNKINRHIWMKAIEVNIRRGDGNPAFMNDEVRIPSLLGHGIPIQDARDWAVAGCAGVIIPGLSMHAGQVAPTYINLAKILEYVLFNGREPQNGKQIGIATGDPVNFRSIDEFIEAFKLQFDYLFSKFMRLAHVTTWVDVSNYRTPFASALTGDCIQKGMDARKGGVRYTQFSYHVSDRGLQIVADSLAAIKKVVFEDKKITMSKLLEALSRNFEGEDDVRTMLKDAPKYGNDDDYVDDIFGELSLWLQRRIGQEKNPYGDRLWDGRSGAVAHVILGKVTGATPDGRKAGEPLADGALSPGQGRDHKGPTAVLNSASKGNHNENNFANLMNMKFDRRLFDDKTKAAKLSHLIEGFFNQGGFHIQNNILSRDTLIDAQRHPERYKNLLVRVAGFSAYFVDLPREVQDEIIARTEHRV